MNPGNRSSEATTTATPSTLLPTNDAVAATTTTTSSNSESEPPPLLHPPVASSFTTTTGSTFSGVGVGVVEPAAAAVPTGISNKEDDENAPAKEEESNATFEPLVKLDEVDKFTGEEEEEILYSQRSKLYVYGETLLDEGTGHKAWKERGIGNVRLLRHRDHGRIRVLMRQEKTHKLIINHALLPGLVVIPHDGSDRSMVWRAEDYSDGQNLVETAFCAKFSDSDVAQAFKDAFVTCQKEIAALEAGLDTKTNDDDPSNSDDAEPLAKALDQLTTRDNDDEDSNKNKNKNNINNEDTPNSSE